MSIAFILYSISVLSALVHLSGFLIVAIIVIFTMYGLTAETDERLPYLKTMIATLVVCSAIQLAVPSKKDMYLIASVSVAEHIAKTPRGEAIVDKSLKILENKLDEIISEAGNKK